jgi:hypothetical protein
VNGWAQSYVEKRVTNSLIKHLGSMHAVEPLAAEPKAIVGAGAGGAGGGIGEEQEDRLVEDSSDEEEGAADDEVGARDPAVVRRSRSQPLLLY